MGFHYVIWVLIFSVVAFFGCGSPLVRAVHVNNTQQVKALLDQGVDVHDSGAYGGNPIHWAASGGNNEIISLLLEKGANIDANHFGMTPIVWALDNDKNDTAKYLIGRGANVDLAIIYYEDILSKYSDSGNSVRWKQNILLLREWKSTMSKGSVPGSKDKIVYLNDGSVIRGEIKNQTKTSVTVKTQYTTIQIEKSKIKEIKYK